MKKACISTLLVIILASCASLPDYGHIDAETIAQIKLLDAYVAKHGLSVEGVTAWNFLHQRNEYRNLVLVRVTEQRLRIDETPRSYPLLEDLEEQVVSVHKGSLPDQTISLVTAHEDIPETMTVPIGRKLFLFFDEKMADGTIRIETGAMWRYTRDLELIVNDPATESYVPPEK